MAHRRRALTATLVALVIAQTLAFSAPKDAPPEPVLELVVEPTVDLLPVARSVQRAPASVAGPVANPVFTVRATAYNSMESQTNAQPFVTATGSRTRWWRLATGDCLAVPARLCPGCAGSNHVDVNVNLLLTVRTCVNLRQRAPP